MTQKPAVVIYTDGACSGNPGPGGWGAILISGTRGWKTADKKPVKNVELWQRLDAARTRHEVHWHWVRGHAGHAENERADELAREGMAPFMRKGS